MARYPLRRLLGYPSPAVGLVALATLVAHLALAPRYGVFRDELYYQACSERLDWGYADFPPLTAVLLRAVRATLGESLLALRIMPALCHAGLVLVTAALARRLEAGRFAQALAALAVAIAPVYLTTGHLFTPNAFEALLWGAAALLLQEICGMRRRGAWLALGVVVGLALQTKHSAAFLCAGLATAVVLTRQRRWLLSPWCWGGVAVAAAIALPNLWWEWRHEWITWTLLAAGREGKNVMPGVGEFLLGQVLILHPFTVPIWLAGVGALLFSRPLTPYRALAWPFVTVFVALLALQGKHYYVAPAYPAVLAAGALAFERTIVRRGWPWMRPAALGLLALGGVALAPCSLPLLPPEWAAPYQRAIERGASATERDDRAPLLQTHADMFGWPELAARVAEVWRALPEADRAQAVLCCGNYGQAGALDRFGPALGLPPAWSGHNAYGAWGPPPGPGQVVVLVGGLAVRPEDVFERIEDAGVSRHPWARESAIPIRVCRTFRPPADGAPATLAAWWPRLRYLR